MIDIGCRRAFPVLPCENATICVGDESVKRIIDRAHEKQIEMADQGNLYSQAYLARLAGLAGTSKGWTEITNEQKYKEALEKIAGLYEEDNEMCDNIWDHCGGNTDDAYYMGSNYGEQCGLNHAAEIARKALKEV